VKIAPYIDRFGDIRKMLVDYFQNVALKTDNRLKEDFFRAARKKYGNPLVIKSEDEFHEFTDNFVYSYRFTDDLTVLDRFVSEMIPAAVEVERSIKNVAGSLKKTLKEQNEQTAKLSQQLEKAYQQVQEIAVKTIEGSSTIKSFANLQQWISEQTKKQSSEK